ncbi:MAG: endonuclease/exonuclease/phosphatase family protein [Shimia sp.]|uniref:endonuclease/exonuclease/phosphatase family protein n=1 Tax=Shimia sp. TaxID=1954381 RepID=UPI0040588757
MHSGEHDHAGHGHAARRQHDQRKPPPRLCRGAWGAARLICATLVAACLASTATADTIRIATFDTEFSRRGPGVLLRDITRGDDQAQAVAAIAAHIAPDILVLQGVDYDADLLALTALRDLMATAGMRYDQMFALPPNTGVQTGVDLDGDGRLGGPADAQGYGRFRGADGMAILSRWPIVTTDVRDFSDLLWRGLPDAQLPVVDGVPFPSAAAQAVQRLSSVGHWVVPIAHPSGAFHVLTFAAGPPVFDGPEDRNGLRNADEIQFWRHYLDGAFGAAPTQRFAIVGNANLDPGAGDGRRGAIQGLLYDPRLRDPLQDAGPTVDWQEPSPGDLRVSYVLPSRDVRVTDAGVFWPRAGTQDHGLMSYDGTAASRHRLVWADINF